MSSQPHVIVLVHGIRTFGDWQDRLARLLKQADASVQVHSFKYGFFSALAFLIPPFRWMVARRLRLYIQQHSEAWSNARVDVVAHSFGTYLVARACIALPPAVPVNIHTVLFAGCVLRFHSHFLRIVGPGKRVARVVNDCGTHDIWVVMAQFAALGMGAAGRTGFLGFVGSDAGVINRYFNFGHSGFFERTPAFFDSQDAFLKAKWVPVLSGFADLAIDPDATPPRAPWWGFVEQSLEPLKLLFLLAPICIVLLVAVGLQARQRASFLLSQSDAAFVSHDPQSARDLAEQALHNRYALSDRQLSQIDVALRRAMASTPTHFALGTDFRNVHTAQFADNNRVAALNEQFELVEWVHSGHEWHERRRTPMTSVLARLGVQSDETLFRITRGNDCGEARCGGDLALYALLGHRLAIVQLDSGTTEVISLDSSDDLKTDTEYPENVLRRWPVIREPTRPASPSDSFEMYSIRAAGFVVWGRFVLAWFDDRTATLADVRGGGRRKFVPTLDENSFTQLESAAFNSTGDRIALWYGDQRGFVIDTRTFRVVSELVGHVPQQDLFGADILFSADGAHILTASADGTAATWEPGSGRRESVFRHATAPLVGIAEAADHETAVTISSDGELAVAALTNPAMRDRLVIRTSRSPVRGLRLSPDEDKALILTESGALSVWSLGPFQQSAQLLNGSDDRVLAMNQDRTVVTNAVHLALDDTQTLDSVNMLSWPGKRAVFSPAGRHLLVINSHDQIVLVDAQTGAEIARPGIQNASSATFLDEAHAIILSNDGALIDFDIPNARATQLFESRWGNTAGDVVVLPGHLIEIWMYNADSGGAPYRVWIYDYDRKQLRRYADFGDQQSFMTAVGVARSEPLMVVPTFGGVSQLDSRTGEKREIKTGSDAPVTEALVSPNDRLVATSSLDGLLAVFDRNSGHRMWTKSFFINPWHLSFSADGRLLLGSRPTCYMRRAPTERSEARSDPTQPDLAIWDAQTGSVVLELSIDGTNMARLYVDDARQQIAYVTCGGRSGVIDASWLQSPTVRTRLF